MQIKLERSTINKSFHSRCQPAICLHMQHNLQLPLLERILSIVEVEKLSNTSQILFRSFEAFVRDILH